MLIINSDNPKRKEEILTLFALRSNWLVERFYSEGMKIKTSLQDFMPNSVGDFDEYSEDNFIDLFIIMQISLFVVQET